jgi:hypothetical protein
VRLHLKGEELAESRPKRSGVQFSLDGQLRWEDSRQHICFLTALSDQVMTTAASASI